MKNLGGFLQKIEIPQKLFHMKFEEKEKGQKVRCVRGGV